MRAWQLGAARGRKSEVKKFTNRDGVLILALVTVVMMAMIVLWMLGYLPLDID